MNGPRFGMRGGPGPMRGNFGPRPMGGMRGNMRGNDRGYPRFHGGDRNRDFVRDRGFVDRGRGGGRGRGGMVRDISSRDRPAVQHQRPVAEKKDVNKPAEPLANKKPVEVKEEKPEVKVEPAKNLGESSQAFPNTPEKPKEEVKQEPAAEGQKPPAEEVPNLTEVYISEYLTDLYLNVDADGVTAVPQIGEGFQYLWGCARATHGVSGGKIAFEVLPLERTFTNASLCVLRVGWSHDEPDLQLGETATSWGYGGTAKKSNSNKFLNYGEKYSIGDAITCYIDLESSVKSIHFAKNGKDLGRAYTLQGKDLSKPFFPTISTKNTKFLVNFGQQPTKYSLQPGYKMIAFCPASSIHNCIKGPDTLANAEFYCMVGVPAAGKSTWAENYAIKNPDKRYCILGTNLIMEKMKIDGLARKRNYHGRWDELINRATKILNTLFKMVEKKFEKFPRNVILDQTNVYESARKRKLKSFSKFGTKIAVVIVNNNAELERRTKKREAEEGKMVPKSAVLEMKANFTMPALSEGWTRIEFPELKDDVAKRVVTEFNGEGKQAKDGQNKAGDKRSVEKPPFQDTLSKKPRTDAGPSGDDRGSRFNDRRDTRNGSSDRGRGGDRKDDNRGGRPSDTRRDNIPDRRGRSDDLPGRRGGGPEPPSGNNRNYNDNNRGGYNDRSNRGGYNDRTARGGYNDANRGGSRGGANDRTTRWGPQSNTDSNNARREPSDGRRDSAGPRPGYDNRGSMGSRNNYDSNRSGYDGGRGGYDSGRGGYDNRYGDQKRDSRDADRKSYDNNRNSFGNNRRDADYGRRDNRHDTQGDFKNPRDPPKDSRGFYSDRDPNVRGAGDRSSFGGDSRESKWQTPDRFSNRDTNKNIPSEAPRSDRYDAGNNNNMSVHNQSTASYGQPASTSSYNTSYYGNQQTTPAYQDHHRNTMGQGQQGGQYGVSQYNQDMSYSGMTRPGSGAPSQQQQQQQQHPANTSYNRGNLSGYGASTEQKSYGAAGYDNSSYQTGGNFYNAAKQSAPSYLGNTTTNTTRNDPYSGNTDNKNTSYGSSNPSNAMQMGGYMKPDTKYSSFQDNSSAGKTGETNYQSYTTQYATQNYGSSNTGYVVPSQQYTPVQKYGTSDALSYTQQYHSPANTASHATVHGASHGAVHTASHTATQSYSYDSKPFQSYAPQQYSQTGLHQPFSSAPAMGAAPKPGDHQQVYPYQSYYSTS